MEVHYRSCGGGGRGVTFFWKGKPVAESRTHAMGFAIRPALRKDIPALPVGINERLMRLQFPLNKTRNVTIISAYAPTLTRPEDVKERFCEDLDQFIRSITVRDKLIILGDFNARVGKDSSNCKGVFEKHGVGNLKSNGLLLLRLCAEHKLCITSTMFRLADKYKTTWMHPGSRQWHLIDYVIVHQDHVDSRITLSSRVRIM